MGGRGEALVLPYPAPFRDLSALFQSGDPLFDSAYFCLQPIQSLQALLHVPVPGLVTRPAVWAAAAPFTVVVTPVVRAVVLMTTAHGLHLLAC